MKSCDRSSQKGRPPHLQNPSKTPFHRLVQAPFQAVPVQPRAPRRTHPAIRSHLASCKHHSRLSQSSPELHHALTLPHAVTWTRVCVCARTLSKYTSVGKSNSSVQRNRRVCAYLCACVRVCMTRAFAICRARWKTERRHS